MDKPILTMFSKKEICVQKVRFLTNSKKLFEEGQPVANFCRHESLKT